MSGTDTKPWTHHRARVARAERVGDRETAELARRDLRAARAEDYIRAVVAAAPPLTPEQIERLRSLLPTSAPRTEAQAA